MTARSRTMRRHHRSPRNWTAYVYEQYSTSAVAME
jgi:hypothetical protein